ncbi:MAG: glutamate--tRNA ligase [Coriobacteriia bacterium]
MSVSPRVRFAPSPTGALHIGGARTAIYNWAFARATGGTFVLRIDDTDAERSTPENTAQILRSMSWLGIDWDEGPEIGGPYAPYFQTGRSENYGVALETMKANGTAYPCFCSAEDLAAKREAARASDGTAGYDRTCRGLGVEAVAARIAAGEPHVWRLSVPEGRGDILVDDIVRGETVFPASAMDDFVLVRSDGTPTYNFATVVDDADMEITHVIRGDDHLSNTPRQILVFEALGHAVPRFAHLSMIWGADGKKLSKRHGATSVEAFRDEGYLPEAILNYVALLGWSLDGETTMVSRETLAREFSLDRISKNPAIFDFEKLEWMNGVYIREMTPDELSERMLPWLVDAGLTTAEDYAKRPGWYHSLVPLIAERAKKMTDIAPALAFLFADDVELDTASVDKALGSDEARGALAAAADTLSVLDAWDHETIEAALRELPASLGVKPKVLFQAVRVAVTGSVVSPPLFESLALLGKEAAVRRMRSAL